MKHFYTRDLPSSGRILSTLNVLHLSEGLRGGQVRLDLGSEEDVNPELPHVGFIAVRVSVTNSQAAVCVFSPPRTKGVAEHKHVEAR